MRTLDEITQEVYSTQDTFKGLAPIYQAIIVSIQRNEIEQVRVNMLAKQNGYLYQLTKSRLFEYSTLRVIS